MAKPIPVGQIVHYVLPHGISRGEHRPAIVVKAWESGAVNLQVFTDAGDELPIVFNAANVERSDKFAPGSYHLEKEKG